MNDICENKFRMEEWKVIYKLTLSLFTNLPTSDTISLSICRDDSEAYWLSYAW